MIPIIYTANATPTLDNQIDGGSNTFIIYPYGNNIMTVVCNR
jgi:hypothetical protein